MIARLNTRWNLNIHLVEARKSGGETAKHHVGLYPSDRYLGQRRRRRKRSRDGGIPRCRLVRHGSEAIAKELDVAAANCWVRRGNDMGARVLRRRYAGAEDGRRVVTNGYGDHVPETGKQRKSSGQ